MALARAFDYEHPRIWSSTTGIIFLGTPNRGAGTIISKTMIDAVVKTVPGIRLQPNVLKCLEIGNDVLLVVVSDFTRLCKTPGSTVSVFCFYEQRPTVVGKIIGDTSLEVMMQVSIMNGIRILIQNRSL